MIQIDNLKFSYGSKPVLSDITLSLEEGKIYGLLGENGVGKTTLLTLLCGLKEPTKGKIKVGSHIPYRRNPSFLSQIYFLPEDMAPAEMKAVEYAKYSGALYNSFNLDKFKEIADFFSVDVTQKMTKMSSGQLKKTYIAFSLSCNSKYIFMDEPTNALDIPSKTAFRTAITKYTDENSVIVISTHQVRDLENIIDPIIILDTNSVLLNEPADRITEKLYFDYGTELKPDSIYSETYPGGCIQVRPNTFHEESKINTETLFNAVLTNKNMIKELFKK